VSRRQAKRAAFYARERQRRAIVRAHGVWAWRDDQRDSINWGACSFRAALFTVDDGRGNVVEFGSGTVYTRAKP